MNRRHLLRYGSALLLNAGVSGRLFAAPATGPRFLLVFLRGGYDSTNLLIPYSSSYYYEARPNIAIAKPDPDSKTSALALDGDWALAPAVRDSVGGMYLQRQVAFIPFAGTDDLSRSHFETQDSIELGQPTTRCTQLSFGLSGASIRHLDRFLRCDRAHLLHRCVATRLPRPRDGTQPLPQERGQAAVR